MTLARFWHIYLNFEDRYYMHLKIIVDQLNNLLNNSNKRYIAKGGPMYSYSRIHRIHLFRCIRCIRCIRRIRVSVVSVVSDVAAVTSFLADALLKMASITEANLKLLVFQNLTLVLLHHQFQCL